MHALVPGTGGALDDGGGLLGELDRLGLGDGLADVLRLGDGLGDPVGPVGPVPL